MKSLKKSVCLISIYRDLDYIRSSSFIKILGSGEFDFFLVKNKHKGIKRYFEVFVSLIKAKIKYNPDVFILGFRGNELFLLARFIAFNKPLIFDSFVPVYESFVLENKWRLSEKIIKFFKPLVYMYELFCLQFSTLILTDTKSHKSFYIKYFGRYVQSTKIKSVYVGANENIFFPKSSLNKKLEKNKFTIFFYGNLLPLHGVLVIAKSSEILKRYNDIQFIVIGGRGKILTEFLNYVEKKGLTNIKYISRVSLSHLADYISIADLCIGGPLGNTPQAQNVITGKTFQFLAMAKPTIIGKNNETELNNCFIDKKNCLLVEQGSPTKLSDAIYWAYLNQDKCKTIGLEGEKLFVNNFQLSVIKKQLHNAINSI